MDLLGPLAGLDVLILIGDAGSQAGGLLGDHGGNNRRADRGGEGESEESGGSRTGAGGAGGKTRHGDPSHSFRGAGDTGRMPGGTAAFLQATYL